MSEEAEMWAALKQESKLKKLNNREKSVSLLSSGKVDFKLLDDSTGHYRVGEFDFWPSTGKFYNQKTGERGRGVFNLLKKIQSYDRS